MGTVESVASGMAIARIAAAAEHSVQDAKSVLTHYYKGEHWASEIIDLSAAAIAELAANLAAATGIDRIILGGSIGLAKGYLEKVQHAISTEPELFQVKAGITQLGH